MTLPTNTGAFIHNGVNCTPNVIQTAQGVPYDNTSSGLSATNVQSAIDEVDGKIFYGVCDTEPTVSGNQRIWAVTLNNGDGFALTAGATVYIKFTYEETGSVYPTIPCLNVNGTGANPIYMNYTSGNTGYIPRWIEGQVCVFTYDGSNRWFQINSVQSAYLTPYSNSSSGLTATNVQAAIDEISKLEYNNSSGGIDMGSYTDANPYIPTTDGYVMMSSETGNSGIIRCAIRFANGTQGPYMYMNVTGSYQIQSVFVKKGMRIGVVSNTTSAGFVKFYPLDS